MAEHTNVNTVVVSGYTTKNIRNFGTDGVSFGVAIGVKVGEEDGKPVYKNGFVNVTGSRSKLDVKPGVRVSITGYQSINTFIPKGSEKEVVQNIIVAQSCVEFDREIQSEVKITGYVADNIKTFGEKGISFGLGFGVKVGEKDGKPVYKNSFLNVKGSTSNLGEVTPGSRVTISGFKSFEFFTPSGSDKEVSKEVLVGMSVELLENTTSESPEKETVPEEPVTDEEVPAPTEEEEPEVPEVEEEEETEDIPF